MYKIVRIMGSKLRVLLQYCMCIVHVCCIDVICLGFVVCLFVIILSSVLYFPSCTNMSGTV